MSDTKATLTRVANTSVVLVREGKRVEVKAKQPFKYTKAEIDEIEAAAEGTLREPTDETLRDADDTGTDDGDTGGDAPAKPKTVAPKSKSKTDDEGL